VGMTGCRIVATGRGMGEVSSTHFIVVMMTHIRVSPEKDDYHRVT